MRKKYTLFNERTSRTVDTAAKHFKKYSLFLLIILFSIYYKNTFAQCGVTDHGGADWTPPNGSTVGGTHVNIGTFTVMSGYTIYVDPTCHFLSITANTINVQGTIDGDAAGNTGGSGGSGGTSYGNCSDDNDNYYVGGAGNAGANGNGTSFGYGGASGGSAAGWSMLESCIDSYGDGYFGGAGGAGGGGGAGYGGTGSGSSYGAGGTYFGYGDAAGNGGTGGIGGAIMGTPAGTDITYGDGGGGAGGGGGSGDYYGTAGTTGGTGGGMIQLISNGTLTITGTITCNGTSGGAGGNGGYTSNGDWNCIAINYCGSASSAWYCLNPDVYAYCADAGAGAGAGGGAGGGIWIQAMDVANITGTLSVVGGNGGAAGSPSLADASCNGYAAGGGGGGGGRIKIAINPACATNNLSAIANITGGVGGTYYYGNWASGGVGTYVNNITNPSYTALTGYTVGSDQTICYNTLPAGFTNTSSPTGGTGSYTYTWQYSTTSSTPGSGSWTDIPSSNSLSYTYTTPLTTTTYFCCQITSGTCIAYTNVITININPLPAAFNVTGGGSFCTGGTGFDVDIDGSEIGVNYQLQVGSVNTGLPFAGTGNAISFGIQTAAGTYTVVATNSTTGCVNTMNGSATIIVNPLPNLYNLTGGGSICSGTGSAVVGLSGSDAGISYQLFANSLITGTPVTGSGSAISFGNQTITGIYTVVATNPLTSCVDTMTGSVSISINTPPPMHNIIGGGPYCAGGSGSDVSLGGSDIGIDYQLMLGGTPVGSAVPGTGVAISFGDQMTVGTSYIVIATNTTSGCSDTMAGIDTISINPLPNPNLGPNVTICSGNTVNINATAGLSYYTWLPITGLSCTNCNNPIASPTDTTTYTVTVTDVNNCANTGSITINVNQTPNANAGSNTSICKGSSTTLTATGGGTGGIYSWSPAAGLSSTAVSNPTANPTINTTYIVTITSAAGCSATANVTVSVNPLPIAYAGRDTSICSGNSVTLDASGGTTYAWSPPFTLSNPNIYNPVASPTFTTIYTVTVTDVNGCSNTSHLTVTVNSIPTASAGNDVSICYASSTTLTASGSGATSFVWNPTTGLSSSTDANPIADPTSTTTYTVTVANAGGCTASASVVVTVNPLPVPNAGHDTTLCSGNSTMLTASGGIAYLWYPTTGLSSYTIANPIASPTSTITYNVSVTNTFGCTATGDVTVTVNASPHATVGPDTAICSGNPVVLTALGGGSYHWNSGDTGSIVTYVPTNTTTYTVTVSYSDGCSSTAGVLITVTASPTLTLTKDPSGGYNYAGQVINFTALPEGYSVYNFYVNNTLVQSGSSNVYQTSSMIDNSQNVSVKVSENGCTSIDTINVEIKPIPNAFIPDGDNLLNKVFVPGLNLTIINRWGQKLYEGTDGWDGKYKGTLVSPGTYYYVIKITDLQNAVKEIKGSVTVVDNKK